LVSASQITTNTTVNFPGLKCNFLESFLDSQSYILLGLIVNVSMTGGKYRHDRICILSKQNVNVPIYLNVYILPVYLLKFKLYMYFFYNNDKEKSYCNLYKSCSLNWLG